MSWRVPAKTFLVGEYLALSQQPAIVLTTSPCFELKRKAGATFPFHQDSPAGLFWAKTPILQDVGFEWVCPYDHKGGLGGSSAEFVALYRAYCELSHQTFDVSAMLDAYLSCQQGRLPSGYDVLAQAHEACVYIDRAQSVIQSHQWPFASIGFILVHTGKKLATHTHLQTTLPTWPEAPMIAVVQAVWQALLNVDEAVLIEGVNAYYHLLLDAKLVAEHVPLLRMTLMQLSGALAVKGCGAMGADVMLMICDNQQKAPLKHAIQAMNLAIIATDEDLLKIS